MDLFFDLFFSRIFRLDCERLWMLMRTFPILGDKRCDRRTMIALLSLADLQ